MNNWQTILRTNFTELKELTGFLQLSNCQISELEALPKFRVNVPRRLAAKIEKGTLTDPLLLQFLPFKRKEQNPLSSLFVLDPVGDSQCKRTPKLLHKYEGRALLVCTSACAMHCRYCFRQNFEYDVQEKGFSKELDLIAQDKTLKEIILSGGDPLSLSNRRLEELLEGLQAISHIRRVRFHSRFPIGIPERIDEGFLSLLENKSFTFWFVIHVNHPRELDEDVLKALKKIQRQGIPILNQSVLLRGVNDTVEVQKILCEILINHGIFPYYLHQLDRVDGSQAFEVPIYEGLHLIDQLKKVLPGYGIPQYVKEVYGEASKLVIL